MAGEGARLDNHGVRPSAPLRLPLALTFAALGAASAGCEEELLGKVSVQPAFSPDELQFGEVTLGLGAPRMAVLENTGTGVFAIEVVEITPGFRVSSPTDPLEGTSVPAGGAVPVEVTFLPSAVGERAGTLTVRGGRASAELRLVGTGVEAPTPNLVLDPTALEFGVVELGAEASKLVTIANTGLAAGTIEALSLESGGAADPSASGEFRAGLAAPIEVAAGASVTVPILFRPSAEGARGDVLRFGVRGGSVLNLAVTGAGHLTRGAVVCAPAQLDFGEVVRGMSRQLQTTCTATVGPVRFVGAALGLGSDPSFTVFNPPGTADLMPGESVTLTVTYAPTVAPATHAGTLEAAYSGEQVASANVQLSGTSVPPAAGDLACAPATLDFGPVERGLSAQLQTVCTANGGPARFTGAVIAPGSSGYFTVAAAPAPVDLNAGDAVTITVAYAPDGLPATHSGALSVGYENDRGTSAASVALLGEVVPPPPSATAISVILRWSTADTDVDLHLTRPGGSTFGPGDCYFANLSPDWGVAGDTSDNPFLDRDDVFGPGPENINLGVTAAGNYGVFVHYYSDHTHGPTQVTAEVYLAGALAGTYTRTLICNDMWNVGTVNWTGTSGTFAPVNSTAFDLHGACF